MIFVLGYSAAIGYIRMRSQWRQTKMTSQKLKYAERRRSAKQRHACIETRQNIF